MSLILSRITLDSLLQVLDWREDIMGSLRTSTFITENEQIQFYESLKTRTDIQLFSIWGNKNVYPGLYGVCGFVNMNLINRIAELSLVVNPEFRKQGIGRRSLHLLLNKGFSEMGLRNIYGETYESNPDLPFWEKIIEEKKAYHTTLPERKYYDNKFHNSLYFNFKNPSVYE